MQVMGQESVRVALGRIALRSRDRLLLCSDGRTNVLDDAAICAVGRPPKDHRAAVEELVEKTRQGGAPDNVTAILAEIA
jgi:protein phosphatase